jgi:hypothetical protein
VIAQDLWISIDPPILELSFAYSTSHGGENPYPGLQLIVLSGGSVPE